MGAGARRIRGDRQGRGRRQPGPRRAADRRVRLLPRSPSRGARRAEAVSERSTWLEAEARYFYLSAIRELGDRKTYVIASARARHRFPDERMGRRDAQRPRLALSRRRRRRRGRPGVPRAGDSIPAASVCGARGVEGRLGCVSRPPLRRSDPSLRVRGRGVSARRLSPVVAVLVGPLARSAERHGHRERALSPRRRRLSELVLRTSRRDAPHHATRNRCCRARRRHGVTDLAHDEGSADRSADARADRAAAL